MRLQNIIIGILIFGLAGTIMFSSVNTFENGYNFTIKDEDFDELTDNFENLTLAGNDNAKSISDYDVLNESLSPDDITGSMEINGFNIITKLKDIFNSFKIAISIVIDKSGIPPIFFLVGFAAMSIMISMMFFNAFTKNRL